MVSFVITPRTIGARVKLSPQQLALWDNPDNPDVPEVIAQMIQQQKTSTNTSKRFSSDAQVLEEKQNEFEEKMQATPGFNDDTKTLALVDCDSSDRFGPSCGAGASAHITLACNTRDVHPRTTGYDLRLALQLEAEAVENQWNVIEIDPSKEEDISDNDAAEASDDNMSISGIEDVMNIPVDDNDEMMAAVCKPGTDVIDAAISGEATPPSTGTPPTSDTPSTSSDAPPTPCDATLISSDATLTSNDATPTSNDATPTSSEAPTSSSDAPPSSTDAPPTSAVPQEVLSFAITDATVRGYGQGVWVVYPNKYITVSSVFAAFHTAD